jgi:aerobic carbon-monoxide dehydrogenase small subunit
MTPEKRTTVRTLISLNVNGDAYEVAVKPGDLLLEVLRDKLGLVGSKRGCDTGKCGACTVIMDGRAVRSCLVLAVAAEGAEITTIEGLAAGGEMHPLQRAFVEHGAIQCGFCSPGMIMFAKAYLDEEPTASREQIKEALTANICRCTGYMKIIEAIDAVARENEASGGRGPAGEAVHG